MDGSNDNSNETCTAKETIAIKPINKDTVHRICSGQVVLTLAIAMKELVENAIDAGANIIDIHLKEYGSELLEVSDNGCGVHKDNFQALTLKHYTSKIREFDDLEHIGTLGFRGEALSSLCALSEVEIITRHMSAETATKLRCDYGGNIISQEVTARQQGTTVSLKNLFSTLPVRKKEFIKNLKKEFAKMCNLLYAYCLLPKGTKYKCTNATAKGSKNTIVATEGHKTVRENIISIFGVKQLASLVDINVVYPDEKIMEQYGLYFSPGEELPFNLEFLVSTVVHGSGRSTSDRQFFYINYRPCEPLKVIKLVNEIYRQFNAKQYPFVYLNIVANSCLVDVNITPDKRQVYLEQEKLLLATVKASLLETFKEFPCALKMQNLEVSHSVTTNSRNVKRGFKRNLTEGNITKSSILETFKKRSRSDDSYNVNNSRKSNDVGELLKTSVKGNSVGSISVLDITASQAEADEKLETLVSIACKLTKDDDDEFEETSSAKIKETDKDITIENLKDSVTERRQVPLELNFHSLKQRFKSALLASQTLSGSINQDVVKFRTNIAPEGNKTAEEELNRHISKDDFTQMELVGQFNMGFIITKLSDDLFIIDQHATDEKYNFEQLQLNTVIDSQKLVNPKLLELTAASKSTLLEHEDVFKKSGFAFKREDKDSNEKVFLTAVPLSEGTVFGKADIDEMIFMLQEDSSQDTMCRPTRMRSMFASRACRKSVMIGKSLSRGDMRRLVDHMGEIDQPWNCPHGRPTMRHLVNLNLLTEKIEK